MQVQIAINVSSLAALVVVFILSGAYVGMEETLEDSLAAELLSDHVRGTGFGTMAVVNGLGDFISSLFVEWLWAVFGAVGFGFALVFMSAGATVVLIRRNSIRGEVNGIPRP